MRRKEGELRREMNGIPEKLCTKCNVWKAVEDFHIAKDLYDGRNFQCKKCVNKRARELRVNNPVLARKRQLKHKYGITPEEFNEIVSRQKGRCLICGDTPILLNVDHNHKTGKIRGLLCGHCNRGLGCFLEDIIKMKKAIKYLEKHNLCER